MLFTAYLDSVENTEEEARFVEELSTTKEHLAQAARAPVVGKLMRALVALSDCGSIEAFMQTEYYGDIEGWDCYIDLDAGYLGIYPGAVMRKKIFGIFACICVGLFLLWLCRRCCRKKAK